MRRPWTLIAIVVFAGLAAGGHASHEASHALHRIRQLHAFAPGLEAEMARHLASDSDPEWLNYCRQVGTAPLADAFGVLGTELRTGSYARFLERREPLEQAILRIATGFARVFAFPLPEVGARRMVVLPPRQDFELRQLERRYIEVEADTSLFPDQRIAIVDGLSREFLALGDPARAISALHVAAKIELDCRRPDRHRARLENVIRLARRHGHAYELCQALGELGVFHRNRGHEDSMRICYDEGIAVARRHGLLNQAARLLQFCATYYVRQGRLALAFERLTEAQRICDQAGGEALRLPLQIRYTKHMAEFGYWDLVERGIRRLPPLLRDFSRAGPVAETQKFEFDADLLRARLAFAQGDAMTASRLLRRWSQAVPRGQARAGYAELFDQWSSGLEDSDQPGRALEVCERGLTHCDTVYAPASMLIMILRKARLLESLGRIDEATVTLDSAEARLRRLLPKEDGMARDIAIHRARLSFRRGHNTLARRQIEGILRQFRAQLREGDSDLVSRLDRFDVVSLRDAIHEIQGFTPAEGYRFELEWRSMSGGAGGSPRRHARKTLRGPAQDPRPVHGTHLVFHFTQDALIRWTATAGRVDVDTLPFTSTQCLAEVREALRLLQTEPAPPGENLGPETSRKLRQLSAALLPPSLGTSGPHPMPLYLSPDGPLLALPFEALPAAGPRGVQLLAQWADVAYVRGWGGDSKPLGGHAVIVSDPKLSPELERRHGWAHGLGRSQAESRAAMARWPDAVLLSGERATKDAVLAQWPSASIIYLAAHHLRNPDAPFVGFVPLAVPTGAPTDVAFLEAADILALDLSACRLAVLASCSSGAPYSLTLRPGPSFGDAFLDAGAGAVVQSFWDVEDEEAREFMTVFLQTWREDGDDAAALGRARRQVMNTPRGVSPRVWAAWSVQVVMPADAGPLVSAR